MTSPVLPVSLQNRLNGYGRAVSGTHLAALNLDL